MSAAPATPSPLDLITRSLKLLTEEQLRQLNNIVVARIRQEYQRKLDEKARSFYTGDLVEFRDKLGKPRRIRIERINAKTFSGRCVDTGAQWRVGITLCRLVGG